MDDYLYQNECRKCKARYNPPQGENIFYCKKCTFSLIKEDMKKIDNEFIQRLARGGSKDNSDSND